MTDGGLSMGSRFGDNNFGEAQDSMSWVIPIGYLANKAWVGRVGECRKSLWEVTKALACLLLLQAMKDNHAGGCTAVSQQASISEDELQSRHLFPCFVNCLPTYKAVHHPNLKDLGTICGGLASLLMSLYAFS